MQSKVVKFAALTGATMLALASAGASAADQAPPVVKAPSPQVPSSFFEFSVDAVYATRGGKRSNDIVLENTVTGEPIVTGRNFSNNWEPGVDARLRAGQGANAFEIRYFGGFDFASSHAATTSPIWNFPTVPPLFGLGAANVNVTHSSQLHSAEANIQWVASPQITVFLGGRVASVREKLRVDADFGGNLATISWGSQFVGAGPQVGAVWRAFGSQTPPPNSVFLDLDVRAAWLYGGSEANFGVLQAIGPAFTANGNHTYWTYLAEAGVKAGYVFGPNAQMHIGYRILYIGDVPLALEQIGKTDVLTPTILKSTDEYWIHGVNVGFLLRF